MKKLKKTTVLISFLVLLFSCQSKVTAPPAPESGSKTTDLLHEAALKYGLTHIAIHCRMYDLDGKKIIDFRGNMCLFMPDGKTLVYNHGQLVLLTPEMRIIWEKKYNLQHQLSRSIFDDNYLSVASTYTPDKKYGFIRYDELVIINPQGKKIKSYNFADYIKSIPDFMTVPPIPNKWTNDKYLNKSYERTHVNSFYELYSYENSRKVLIGYVANCFALQTVFIFDKNLKLKKAIDFDKRGIHDVQPLNENELIFYVNQRNHFDYQAPKLSYIETYDLKNQKFNTLYENKSKYLASAACSSVQPLGDTHLFILHSACSPMDNQESTDARFEIVDLIHKKSQVVLPENPGAFSTAYLINAESYLKLTRGL